MINRKKADDFYQSLDGLKDKMLTVASDIEDKKSCLKASLDEMTENISSLAIIDSEISKNNKKMFDNCLLVSDDIKNSTKKWKSIFEDILSQENFRNEFKDSFLVIIYGKVKAGKSSFGNFIADSCLDNQKPTYFKYDEAGENRKDIAELEELDDDEFDVKNTEATIEIQGFRLSGLTWIDTPGLASMTAENGALAKEYIESADLVVYPISSDAPGRHTDTQEIIELFDKNKTVNVLITKSDKTQKQVVNGKITKVFQNKTVETRKKQEEEVVRVVKNLLDEEKKNLFGDVYSLSVHGAKKAIDENDNEMYDSSQVDLFFEQMTNVIKSEALDLKTQAPHNRLKSFVELEIIGSDVTQNGSVQKIRNSLKNIESKRKDILKDLTEQKENLKGDLSLIIEYEIDKRFTQLNKENVNKILDEILNEIQNKFIISMKDIIEAALDGFNDSILDLNFQLENGDFEIKDKKAKNLYNDTKRKKNHGRIIGGVGAGLLTAAALNSWNPVGWSIAAVVATGLAAEIIAMAAGEYIGGKTGEYFGEDKEEEVIIGNTKIEVISNMKLTVQELIDEHADAIILELDQFYFEPISNFSNAMNNIINDLESNLKRCVND